jgi:hypothetical protein
MNNNFNHCLDLVLVHEGVSALWFVAKQFAVRERP